MNLLSLPSPNFSARKGDSVSMLVLHYTGMPSEQAALQRLCDVEAQVSSHYVVNEAGNIYQLVDEDKTAWHSGVSYWRGYQNINPVSIGIEIVNPGHEFGYVPFPKPQMEAVAALSQGIIARHSIKAGNVVGHSDVAPLRKTDPGELFDWKWLAAQGVGHWVEIGEKIPVSRAYPEKLSEYGYEKAENAEHLSKIILAFQRHFRPTLINGIWDETCESLLAELLKLV